MALTLGQFISKHNGKKLDFDKYYGAQCVDLVQYWVRNLGYPPFWGNAVDIIRQAGSNYKRINRTSTNYPLAGDIVVWGGELGHTSVAISGTKGKFTSFDQNWPPGSAAHKQGHYYNNVLGWLRPKKLIKNKIMADKIEVYTEVFRTIMKAIPNKYQIKSFVDSKNTPRAYGQKHLLPKKYVSKTTFNTEIKKLQGKITKLEKNIENLKVEKTAANTHAAETNNKLLECEKKLNAKKDPYQPADWNQDWPEQLWRFVTGWLKRRLGVKK